MRTEQLGGDQRGRIRAESRAGADARSCLRGEHENLLPNTKTWLCWVRSCWVRSSRLRGVV